MSITAQETREERILIGVRVRKSIARRLRSFSLSTRLRQQDVVEDALDAHLPVERAVLSERPARKP